LSVTGGSTSPEGDGSSRLPGEPIIQPMAASVPDCRRVFALVQRLCAQYSAEALAAVPVAASAFGLAPIPPGIATGVGVIGLAFGAARGAWGEAMRDRALRVFEERLAAIEDRMGPDWPAAVSDAALQTIGAFIDRAEAITGEARLEAIASLVAGASVTNATDDVPSIDLLDIACQLTEGDIRVFAALWRARETVQSADLLVTVRTSASRLAGDSGVALGAVEGHVARLQATGVLVLVPTTRWNGSQGETLARQAELENAYMFTTLGRRLVELSDAGGWRPG